MQSTNKPLPYLVPFAQNDAARTEIPATTADATRFSQQLGSPPLTGMPPEAGGVPPQLSDFNGAMNQLARVPWWTLLGGRFAYDADWATNSLIGGYPRGAVLPAALGSGAVGIGEWYNTTEDNTANPDTVGTGWVPGYQYGATSLTAQTGGTVVLTPAQAAKTTLRISGTLTSNLIIVVPDWVYAWSVYNTTTGAFSVSIKNAATAAVVVPQDGLMADIRSDGTSVTRVEQAIPVASQIAAGVQRNATSAEVQAFSSTTLTVTPGTLGVAIPQATTSAVGRVRLATVPEASGDSAALAVTPAGLTAVAEGKANLAGAAFTGSISSTGTITSGERFASSTPNVVLAAGSPGAVILRPNGPGSETGEVRVNAAGALASPSTITSAGSFLSSTVNVVLAPVSTGTVLFRPNGAGSTVGEARIGATGAMVVAGALTAGGGFQNGSSRTVKDHVSDIDPAQALQNVLALRGVLYRYRGAEEVRAGYYAEEVRELRPEAVTEAGEDSFSPLLLEDAQMLPDHTGAIQELYRMVRELQEKQK